MAWFPPTGRGEPATGVAEPQHPDGTPLAVVTSSQGFIMRHRARRLSTAGWRVWVVDVAVRWPASRPVGALSTTGWTRADSHNQERT